MQVRKSREKLGEIPFSSQRKRMSTIIATEGGGARVHTKGASEIVLGLCSHMLTPQVPPITPDRPLMADHTPSRSRLQGEVVPLDPDTRLKYEQMIVSYASQGLRTLTLAYK